jgi:hypothetical protein
MEVLWRVGSKENTERERRLKRRDAQQAKYKKARQQRAPKAKKYSKRKPAFGYGPSKPQAIFAPPRVHAPARAAGVIPGGGAGSGAVPAARLRLLLSASDKDLAKKLKDLVETVEKPAVTENKTSK